MNDTSPEFGAMYEALFMAMTPEERVSIAASMCETARALVMSSMPDGLDETGQRRWICERYYGRELAEKAYPR